VQSARACPAVRLPVFDQQMCAAIGRDRFNDKAHEVPLMPPGQRFSPLHRRGPAARLRPDQGGSKRTSGAAAGGG